ncbi:MAG: methyl-accepting chemotaxis protein [Nitrospirae bacterium]|nr:methyl-accepting chemotaxis protein [Nitrospirota bacterium]
MKRHWRRRNYFIKKELQGKYIFNFFIFVIGGSIIFTLIFSLLSYNTLTVVYKDYNLQIGKTPLVLLMEILESHWIFIVTTGFSVVILSMFLTHRFAGPIYRFEKSVEEMIKGNFNFEVRLRKKDEGKELAYLMNQLLSIMSSRIKELRLISDEIQVQISDISNLINSREGCKEISANLQKIHDSQRKLTEILSHFQIKHDT